MNEQLSDEFLDLLSSVIDGSRARLLHVISNEEPGRDRYKQIEFLVDSLRLYEESPLAQRKISNSLDQEYGFLKLILEKNSPIPPMYEEEIFGRLGIKRDLSELSLSEKKGIAMQSSAQILWDLEGNKIPTLRAMTKRLLDKSGPFFSLHCLNDERTVEDWIRPLFPVPSSARKSHWSKKKHLFGNAVSIPGIFSETGVNFQKLHFAVICLTRILQHLDWRLSQILLSKFISLLVDPLEGNLQVYVREWAVEAFSSKGAFFDII